MWEKNSISIRMHIYTHVLLNVMKYIVYNNYNVNFMIALTPDITLIVYYSYERWSSLFTFKMRD